MRPTGYRKIFFAYMPIFFFVVTLLFSLFFVSVYEMARKDTQRANEVFAEHVMQTLDYDLNTVDQLLIKEIITNDKLAAFLSPANPNDPFLNFQMQEQLADLISTFPIIDSIYIVRNYDQVIVSNISITHAEDFSDWAFASGYQPGPYRWTALRLYADRYNADARPVISLVHTAPLLGGSEGKLVVNVSSAKLAGIFAQMSQSDLSRLALSDSAGQWIVPETKAESGAVRLPASGGVNPPAVQSEISGLEIHLLVKSGGLAGIFSAVSSFWLLLALIGVAIGVLWLVRASRKQYRPVESILDKIGRISYRKSVEWTGTGDEYSYIEHAIERMIESYRELEEEATKANRYRRKVLFMEIMEGQRAVEAGEWQAEKERLGWMEKPEEAYAAAIVEIDKFRDFQAQYAEKDQVLLRFVMVNVLEELAQMHRLEVWVDWLTASQMAALVQADAEDGAAVREMLEQLRRWVETNLAFTLTIAIGEPVADINEAVLSRDGAEQALRRKSTLGINRILMPEPGAKKPEPPVYEQLQDIRELAERFRSGDDRWEERFAELAAHIRRSDCERAEIVNLVQYLQYQLSKEIRSLPEAYSEMWNRQTLPAIEAGLESFETFDELEAELHTRLKELYDHIEALRESNSVYATIRQVREYIETHYHDSSLSLVQLGDQFNLSPTYLSRLFKEEMGEKLIDCIAKIRMEHAKRLLLAGELPVQDIAERVGYVHAFSFIRAFKKLVGKTPGDYRKEGG